MRHFLIQLLSRSRIVPRLVFVSLLVGVITVTGALTTRGTPSGLIFAGPAGIPAASGSAYASPGPVISSITPSQGPVSGGTPIVILGNNFSGVLSIQFNGTPVSTGSYTVTSSSEIDLITPAGSLGQIPVVVATGIGPSNPGYFTYVPNPTPTSTPSSTSTSTATSTPTATPTATTPPTSPPTHVPVATATQVPVVTPGNPLPTTINTALPSPTTVASPTSTPTTSAANTPTAPTVSPTNSASLTPTAIPIPSTRVPATSTAAPQISTSLPGPSATATAVQITFLPTVGPTTPITQPVVFTRPVSKITGRTAQGTVVGGRTDVCPAVPTLLKDISQNVATPGKDKFDPPIYPAGCLWVPMQVVTSKLAVQFSGATTVVTATFPDKSSVVITNIMDTRGHAIDVFPIPYIPPPGAKHGSPSTIATLTGVVTPKKGAVPPTLHERFVVIAP